MPIATELERKEETLRAQLGALPSLIVALSGGTDSAYLAWVANEVLVTRDSWPVTREQRVLSVTALSPSFPEAERRDVEEFVRRHGLAHEFIETQELENPLYVANQPNRCYHCKDELFTRLGVLARARGFAAVAYGMNLDDEGDFRPGQQAAREHGALAPLREAGLSKAEIRELSRRAGLETWSKPAAACLASRLAHGVAVTADILKQVEQGEAALRRLGFRQVRVRYHEEHAGALARIEIAPDELPRALTPEMAAKFREIFTGLGFRFVTLDLEGYRQGSLNPQPKKEA